MAITLFAPPKLCGYALQPQPRQRPEEPQGDPVANELDAMDVCADQDRLPGGPLRRDVGHMKRTTLDAVAVGPERASVPADEVGQLGVALVWSRVGGEHIGHVVERSSAGGVKTVPRTTTTSHDLKAHPAQ